MTIIDKSVRDLRSAPSVLAGVAVLAAAVTLQATPAAAACRAESGATRAALVELYTSEGCSSCPPADRRLSQLTHAGPTVIPLALHVDYWDSIGWKDRFADPAFSERQRWEVRANGERTSFTPHFFVNGREVLDWRSELPRQLDSVATVAPAQLTVAAEPDHTVAGRWHVRVDGRVPVGQTARGPLQLFVAVTEDGLSSQVDAGENRGVRLEHDAVARRFLGPFPVRDGAVAFDRVVDVAPAARGHVGVVAFIQDASTAEVLQAVATGQCGAV